MPSAPCAMPGCAAPGEYKAPKSRDQLRDYQFLCLDHIREFNKSWDYFKGMQSGEIEDFIEDAVHGHRPTWQREDHVKRKYQHYTEQLREGVSQFFRWDSAQNGKPARPRLPARERRALAALELSEPCPPEQLKAQYRLLVKRYHPDLHPGDSLNEERFKAITGAYAYLLKMYSSI